MILSKMVRRRYFGVFLGGTTNFDSVKDDWRTYVTKNLENHITYFNPVVSDWDEKQIEVENRAKADSDYRLYVITPQMVGFYSIAELVHDSIKFGDSTIITILPEYNGKCFSEPQLIVFNEIIKMCAAHKATIIYSLDGVVHFLNNNIRRW